MLEEKTRCVSPVLKQCFVTLGVALSMAQVGLVMGLPATLVPQLRAPASAIAVDDHSASWIAAVPGFTFLLGNLATPAVMGRFGRKVAKLVSVALLALAWTGVALAHSVGTLLLARSLQGVGIGMASIVSPVLVGEYTSPRNRGAFLMALSVAISVGVLIVHTVGLNIHWSSVAIICAVITVVDAAIVACSPESPSWLADKGRYDECRKNFRWLRGDSEEEELEKMINFNLAKNKVLDVDGNSDTCCLTLRNSLVYFGQTIKKPEFYKPIIIMMHIFTMAHWSGVNVFASYAVDLVHLIIGTEANTSIILISFDAQRIVSNALGMIIIKHVKRKTMLIFSVSLNLAAMIVIAGYLYAKINELLPFDSIYIGLALAHIHMFSIAIGALPISYILAGELFPLEYKGLAGGISAVTFSFNVFTAVKVTPFLFASIGLHGTYLLCCGIIIYGLIVTSLMLPETKDRTLQDIENDFRRKKKELDVEKTRL